MPKFKIIPYKGGSKSAAALAAALEGKCLKVPSTYMPTASARLINWGCSVFPPGNNYAAIAGLCENTPANVKAAANKLEFFKMVTEGEKKDAVKTSDLPEFWVSRDDISPDFFESGGVVVCRTILSGHSGAGIVLAGKASELVDAPLYVRYIPKKDEYRVHLGVMEEELQVIAVQRKARKLDFDNPNWQVRNLQNGFVYVRDNVNPPPEVIDAAKRVFRRTNLDFGAVDVIWNDKQKKAYVLEINTAPGLEGQTVTDYANYFKAYLG